LKWGVTVSRKARLAVFAIALPSGFQGFVAVFVDSSDSRKTNFKSGHRLQKKRIKAWQMLKFSGN